MENSCKFRQIGSCLSLYFIIVLFNPIALADGFNQVEIEMRNAKMHNGRILNSENYGLIDNPGKISTEAIITETSNVTGLLEEWKKYRYKD